MKALERLHVLLSSCVPSFRLANEREDLGRVEFRSPESGPREMNRLNVKSRNDLTGLLSGLLSLSNREVLLRLCPSLLLFLAFGYYLPDG